MQDADVSTTHVTHIAISILLHLESLLRGGAR